MPHSTTMAMAAATSKLGWEVAIQAATVRQCLAASRLVTTTTLPPRDSPTVNIFTLRSTVMELDVDMFMHGHSAAAFLNSPSGGSLTTEIAGLELFTLEVLQSPK